MLNRKQDNPKNYNFEHRGRIQAQGEIEESEPWAQKTPLTKNEGLQKVDNLKKKIPLRALELRKKVFEKVEQFIEQAAKNGGISAPFSKPFLVKGTEHERVDLEVKKGIAFIDQ